MFTDCAWFVLSCQVKDDGLVDDEKKEEEEMSLHAENEESIVGTVATV